VKTSVLLCDDEVHILRAAEFKIARAGFDVRCAFDGQEAWEAICRQRPDILITDFQMPRLNGLELIARVRDNPATTDLPVIVLTAKGFEVSPQELAEKMGVLAVLGKPFSPRELLRLVESIAAGLTLKPNRGAEQIAAGAALGAQPGAAASLAGLFVVFFASHLLLDSTAFDQFSETTNGLLNRFAVPNVQLNHNSSFR